MCVCVCVCVCVCATCSSLSCTPCFLTVLLLIPSYCLHIHLKSSLSSVLLLLSARVSEKLKYSRWKTGQRASLFTCHFMRSGFSASCFFSECHRIQLFSIPAAGDITKAIKDGRAPLPGSYAEQQENVVRHLASFSSLSRLSMCVSSYVEQQEQVV